MRVASSEDVPAGEQSTCATGAAARKVASGGRESCTPAAGAEVEQARLFWAVHAVVEPLDDSATSIARSARARVGVLDLLLLLLPIRVGILLLEAKVQLIAAEGHAAAKGRRPLLLLLLLLLGVAILVIPKDVLHLAAGVVVVVKLVGLRLGAVGRGGSSGLAWPTRRLKPRRHLEGDHNFCEKRRLELRASEIAGRYTVVSSYQKTL